MSTQRHCKVYLASNLKWYMELGDFEYARRDNSTTYGPFNSEDEAYDELRFHSNPGGSMEDSSGRQSPPTESPNGFPVRPPSKRRY
jgi:hypothetical protein